MTAIRMHSSESQAKKLELAATKVALNTAKVERNQWKACAERRFKWLAALWTYSVVLTVALGVVVFMAGGFSQ